MRNFKTRLQNRDYPARIVEKHLSDVKFSDRKASLAQKNRTARKKILPFVTQYHLALPNQKDTLMGKWHRTAESTTTERDLQVATPPPPLSYRKGKSLKDVLVKAKLEGFRTNSFANWRSCVVPSTHSLFCRNLP